MTDNNRSQAVWRGKFLTMMQEGRWEYVTRTNARTAVGIVPVTDDGELVIIEQHRTPIQAQALELPAGLVGDLAGAEDEDLTVAARRELLEETGYVAERMEKLFYGVSTPGLADEAVTFFLATGLRKEAAGGGDDSEDIHVHLVRLAEVDTWIAQRIAAGLVVDLKLYTGLYFLQRRGILR